MNEYQIFRFFQFKISERNRYFYSTVSVNEKIKLQKSLILKKTFQKNIKFIKRDIRPRRMNIPGSIIRSSSI